jgi:hypothetical protein
MRFFYSKRTFPGLRLLCPHLYILVTGMYIVPTLTNNVSPILFPSIFDPHDHSKNFKIRKLSLEITVLLFFSEVSKYNIQFHCTHACNALEFLKILERGIL